MHVLVICLQMHDICSFNMTGILLTFGDTCYDTFTVIEIKIVICWGDTV
jgi:hypothetical protein